MPVEQLDALFPWIVFAYGVAVTLVLSSERLQQLGRERVPAAMWERFVGHQRLAVVCLAVGALWVLQDLIVG